MCVELNKRQQVVGAAVETETNTRLDKPWLCSIFITLDGEQSH
jgi:hypothetical protein